MNSPRAISWISLFAILLSFSCKQESKKITHSSTTLNEKKSELAFEVKSIHKQLGNCETDENCLEVTVKYPILKGATPAFQNQVNATIENQIIASMEIEEELADTISLEGAAQTWVDTYQEYLSDEEADNVRLYIAIEGSGSIYKHFAVISLPVSTYAGGAHPNFYQTYSNFNLNTGEEIEYEDFVRDSAAFHKMAEKAFYESVLDEDGSTSQDDFFWGKPFYLPANFAITEKGIHLEYSPYEAAAYVFGSLDFMLSYEQLGNVIALPE